MREKSIDGLVYFYLSDPKDATDQEHLRNLDRRARNYIKQFEECIDEAKKYRERLAKRAIALETMPYHVKITLKRHTVVIGKRSRIEYTLKCMRIFQDGTENELRETRTFTGKERGKAVREYDALVKCYPGCEATKDISKRWHEYPRRERAAKQREEWEQVAKRREEMKARETE